MELMVMKIAGWYLIITAIVGIVRFKHMKKVIAGLKSSDSIMLFIFGAYELILGLLIVTSYNIWEWSPKLIITLIGWGALIEGVALMALPRKYAKFVSWSGKGPVLMIGILVGLVLGAYLLMQTGSIL
jgi:hypothetical protein